MGLDDTVAANQGVAPDKAERATNPAAKPDKSAAELDVGWGERAGEPDRPSEDDERLLRERPPHWE